MPQYILDTDILSLLKKSHPEVSNRVRALGGQGLAISVITVEEQLRGWYTSLRKAKSVDQIERAYNELAETARFYVRVQNFSFPKAAILRYLHLHSLKLNVKKNDLRIAAIALEANATVVTRNLSDFTRVPGLTVEDWSVP